MKKIVLWCMSTLTVLVLLFGYHTSTSSEAAATADASTVTPVSGSAAAAPTTVAGAAPPTTAAVPTTAAAASTTVTGDPASTKYGPVQVQVTVVGGTITGVSVVDYPSSDGKDRQINGRALPVLVQETLTAQDADIDMVSGATYTSNGYLQSLQSALDQAGL